MTGRERILAVLEGKQPDHIPFVPLIGRYYVRSLPEMGIPLEKIAPWEKAATPALQDHLNMHEVETIRYVGGDVLYRHVMAYRTVYDQGVSSFERREEDALIQGFRTPRGEIHQVVKTRHGTDYIHRHMLQSEEDLRVYLEVLRAARDTPYYAEPREMDDFIADSGILSLTGPVTPLQEMLQFKMGVARTTYALMDYPGLMQEIFGVLHERNKGVYRILAAAPSPMTITYEDTSTTVISPAWYTRYFHDQLDDYAAIIRGAGQCYVVHMCGTLKAITAQISRGRMDGIDSVCPPETGDLEPGDAVREIGKLIIGGLDPAFLALASPEECWEYAFSKLRQVPPGAPFMLGTGDSTAALTPVENLRAVSRAVREFSP